MRSCAQHATHLDSPATLYGLLDQWLWRRSCVRSANTVPGRSGCRVVRFFAFAPLGKPRGPSERWGNQSWPGRAGSPSQLLTCMSPRWRVSADRGVSTTSKALYSRAHGRSDSAREIELPPMLFPPDHPRDTQGSTNRLRRYPRLLGRTHGQGARTSHGPGRRFRNHMSRV